MRGLFFTVVVSVLMAGCATAPLPTKSIKQDAFLNLDPAGKNVKANHFNTGNELLGEVQRLGGPQGEYETNEVFAKRMSKFENFSVYSVVSPSQIKFDKETGSFSFKEAMPDGLGFGFNPGTPGYESMKNIYPSLLLGEDVKVTGQYQAQNSFGASATIEKRKINRFFVVFSPVPKQIGHVINFSFVGSPKITPAEMEAEKENLGMLVTLKPVPDYLKVSSFNTVPTISTPYDSDVHNYFFQAKVFWVKLVNVKTGKVYDDEVKMKIEVW